MSHSPPNVTHTTQIHPRAGGRAHETAAAAAVTYSASKAAGVPRPRSLLAKKLVSATSFADCYCDHVAAGHLPTLLGSPSRSHSGLRLAPPWGDGSLRGT